MKNEKKLSLAEINRQRTTEKVKEALDKLKRRNMPINISSVSKMAGISRKTISSNRPDIKAMIEEARSLQIDLETSKRDKTKSTRTTQAERIKKT